MFYDLMLYLMIFSLLCDNVVAHYCPNCEPKECHKVYSNKLNIHLVPHTHDDAGWLKTVDQYYYGGNQRHAPFGVQYIIDSVLAELEADPNRRFIYAESSFLWRWWQDRGAYHREKLKRLIKYGRFRLVHGGWVISDEATAHYTALIHQMSFGLKFLNEEFGACSHPNIAWQIDSFGHSSEVALEFADMGYDAVFFGRIERDDLRKRKHEKTLEMSWRLDPDFGVKGELFTGILYNLYQPPDGFCFDAFCNDEPIMDNPEMHGNNVQRRVSSFITYAKEWSNSYKTNNVMITMGGDFNYMVAGSWFTNIDKLIKYGNELHKEVNLIYSTPDCYVEALNKANITWPVKDKNDFFPYSSYEGKYWTGYYSSRPTLKYLAQKVNQLLIACNSLTTFLRSGHEKRSLFILERAVALLQHHDAISGTEKQHVANDYAIYLQEAINAGEEIFTTAFRKYFGNHYRHQHFCMKTNISECRLTEERNVFMVHLYNPLSFAVDVPIRLPVQYANYVVIGQEGIMDSELIPLPKQVLNIPGRKSTVFQDLFFTAKALTPLAVTSYKVKREILYNVTKRSYSDHMEEYTCNETCNETVTVDNYGLCQLKFNSSTGLLKSIVLDKESIELEQSFFYYKGKRKYQFMTAGAYTLSPSENEAIPVTNKVNLSVYKGRGIIEIHQIFNPWVSQIIRLKKDDCSIDFNWLVGPINFSDDESKEIITRYKSKIQSNGVFWTDSNGRRFMERKRNMNSTNEPVASNYYPVTSAARIGDKITCLTILTDRAQGASSLRDGELEFLIHRRLNSDDGKGVIEPLNEMAYGKGLVARGTHTIQLLKTSYGCYEEAAVKHRKTAIEISQGPWISVSTGDTSTDAEREPPRNMNSLLNSPLPENVHILSLQRRTNITILVRIEHIFEKHEHSRLSQPANVNLLNLFKNVFIHEIVELTLDGNKYKDCITRLEWKHENAFGRLNISEPLQNIFSIILKPMEIRTFLLTIL